MPDKPAFPVPPIWISQAGDIYGPTDGLTRRELFAAMAMQGLLSRLTNYSDIELTPEKTVEDSLMVADMLIVELDKGND